MSPTRASVACVLTVIVCAGEVRAQGLGAAAARAAEERSAPGRKAGVALTDRDLPKIDELERELRDFQLTMDAFNRYVYARSSILELRTRSRTLDQYLLRAEAANTDPLAMEAIIVDQRELLACLDRETLPPRAYTLTEIAYRRAVIDAALSDGDIDRLPAARAANATFVRKHDNDIRNAISHYWGEKEKWLQRYRGAR
jgi:hypothetical protein